MTEKTIVCIAGDGIGPEITEAMKKVVAVVLRDSDLSIRWRDLEVGLPSLEKGNDLLPQEVLDEIKMTGVAIKGPTATPVGTGHRSVNVALRQSLELYANVRPIRWFQGIETPIKRPENVNLTIFRENTEDVYAGIEYAAGSDEAHALHDFLKLPKSIPYDSALGLKPVSERSSRRLMRSAIAYARENSRKRITIVHKGNIMKYTEGAFAAWSDDEAHTLLGDSYLSSQEYLQKYQREIPAGRILVQQRIADAMFQELLLKPEEHEVIVTLNLNGDYLSDAAAALVGGLGLAPGVNVGDDVVLFEAVHGTAPDIAGKNLANPSALILSAALMLEHLGYRDSSVQIYSAIEKAIRENRVTGDLIDRDTGAKSLSCSEYTDYLCELLSE